MPLSSSINVETEVNQFKQVNELFKKYADSVKKQPDAWAYWKFRIDDANKAAANLNEYMGIIGGHQDELTRKGSLFSSAADKAGKAFQSIAKDAKNSAEYLASSALSLFQISLVTGLVFGLLGSGFGIYMLDRTAGEVQDRRRKSLGLGVGYGDLQSFETNFARYGIDAGTLSNTASGMYDVTNPAFLPLYSTGSVRGNAADSTVQLLKTLPALFAGVSDQMIGPTADRYGLTQIMSIREIVSYLKSSPEERAKTIDNYERDKFVMNMSKEAQIRWADFDTAMTRAGHDIETIFGKSLVPLAGSLTELSASSTRLIESVIDSGTATKAIDKIGEGIDWLASEVESPEFKQSMKNFAAGVEGMIPYVVGIGNVLKFAAKFGVNAYRLWNDPNYNPSMSDLIFGKTSDDGLGGGPNSSGLGPKYDAMARQPSLRYGTWKGPHTLPSGSGGPVVDPDGHMFVPFSKTPKGSISGVKLSDLSPIEGETPEGLAKRINSVYPQLSNQECVTLAMKVADIHGTVRDWRRGVGVGDGQLPTGTPIATFMNRNHTQSDLYDGGQGVGISGNNTTHAAVLFGYTKDGILVAEQYVGIGGVHPSEKKWGDPRGGEYAAENYAAINDPLGLPAGDSNPLRAKVLNHISAQRFSGGAESRNKYYQDQKNKDFSGPQSFLKSLKGRNIPQQIIVSNETAGSAMVSTNRIRIAT